MSRIDAMQEVLNQLNSIMTCGNKEETQEAMLFTIASTLVSISTTLADIRDALMQEGDV